MGSRSLLVYGLHAVATFTGVGGVGAFLRTRGFSAFLRNGAGDYTLTLSDAIDTTNTQYALFGSPGGNAAGTTLDLAIATAATIRCRSGVAAVLTDMIFQVMIVDLGVA